MIVGGRKPAVLPILLGGRMIGRRLALEGRSVLGAADELLKLAVERAGGLVVDKSACEESILTPSDTTAPGIHDK